MFDLASMRGCRETLEEELRAAGAEPSEKNFLCPFHNDTTPSASISEHGGIWRFHCFSCDFHWDFLDVRAHRLGTTPEELLKENKEKPKPKRKPRTFNSPSDVVSSFGGNCVDHFLYYRLGESEPCLLVIKTRNKGFPQYHEENGKWVSGGLKEKIPLYGVNELESDLVFFVEGEKDANTLIANGHVATTTALGAGKAKESDLTPLEGKTVIVWMDNDEPGEEHAKDVTDRLLMLGCTVKRINQSSFHPPLPPKGDATDFFNDTVCADSELERIVRESSEVNLCDGVIQNIEDCINGKRTSAILPWRMTYKKINALLPGTVTVLLGDPGNNKSFWLLQAAQMWHRELVPFSILELEDGRDYHLQRALAQRAGLSRMSFPDWCREHPQECREAAEKNKAWMNSFGRHLMTIDNESMEDVAGWVEDRAKAGDRVIVIDPITAAMSDKDVWKASQAFLMSCKKSVEKYGASLIIVSHPKSRKQKEGITLDVLANGQAWGRFSHTVLWLGKYDDGNLMAVRGPGGDDSCEVNRYIKVLKCRNGMADGWMFGYLLSYESLTMVEQGIIVR